MACPAGKSKTVSGSEPCKGPAAAPPAADADAPATDVVRIVKMAVKLPVTKEQFNTGKQANFKQSIASAARVSTADVTIDKIENMRRFGRRLLAGSIRVDTSIVAADQTSAKSMANTLTVDKINSELRNNGLPQAEILDPPQVKQIVKDDLKDSNRTPIIIAAVVSSVVILIAVGAFVFVRRARGVRERQESVVDSRTEPPSPLVELDQVMMDVAPTPRRQTKTIAAPELPEINPVDISKPPEELRTEIAARIRLALPRSNVTVTAESGFISVRPMEVPVTAESGFISVRPMEVPAALNVTSRSEQTSKVIS
jgi:hypothetical protein